MYRSGKFTTQTCLYGLMYLQLDDYPTCSDKISDIFETHIDSNLRCIHGYTNCDRHADLITWVSNSSWDVLLFEFIHAVKISACPRKKICNKCEQSNTRGDILNADDNADDDETFWFSESFYKIAPANIDEYTRNICLNMHKENLRPQRKINNDEKKPDKRYQKNKIDDKESDKKIGSVKLTKKK